MASLEPSSDDKKQQQQCLIILAGVVGSGKSTLSSAWSKALPVSICILYESCRLRELITVLVELGTS